MFSLQVLVTLAIIAVAGVLLGMLLGHYITIKATAALTSLEARVKSVTDLFHTRLTRVEDTLTTDVLTPLKKRKITAEDVVTVIKEDIHSDVTNIEKEVTNDITTIGGKIKQL